MKQAIGILALIAAGLCVGCSQGDGSGGEQPRGDGGDRDAASSSNSPEAGSGADSGSSSGDDSGSSSETESGSSSGMDAAADAAPPDSGAVCIIAGATYQDRAANPANACQICDVGLSTSAWSDVGQVRMGCGSAATCYAGTCWTGCVLNWGIHFAPGEPDPNNPCMTCQPSTSTSSFTSVADGTACGNGQVCAGGACGTQCDIGGTVYPAGADPGFTAGMTCHGCQPGTSTTAWTPVVDGTPCFAYAICVGGACTPLGMPDLSCLIDGIAYQVFDANPNDPCQSCQPSNSSTSWSSSCGSSAGCFIRGTFHPPGLNPLNPCLACVPGASTTAWSDLPDGTVCGGGHCASGACE